MECDENASKAIHLERNAVLWWMDPERLKYAFGAGVCRRQGLEQRTKIRLPALELRYEGFADANAFGGRVRFRRRWIPLRAVVDRLREKIYHSVRQFILVQVSIISKGTPERETSSSLPNNLGSQWMSNLQVSEQQQYLKAAQISWRSHAHQTDCRSPPDAPLTSCDLCIQKTPLRCRFQLVSEESSISYVEMTTVTHKRDHLLGKFGPLTCSAKQLLRMCI